MATTYGAPAKAACGCTFKVDVYTPTVSRCYCGPDDYCYCYDYYGDDAEVESIEFVSVCKEHGGDPT
jgi:hypothetical protein